MSQSEEEGEEETSTERNDAADYDSRFGCGGGPITRASACAAQEITAIVVFVVLNYDFVFVRLKTTD